MSTNYPTQELAEAAVRQACIDGGESYCDDPATYSTVFVDQVYVGAAVGAINGVSVNVSEATEAAVLDCITPTFDEAFCRSLIPSSSVGGDHICGDGSRHPTTDNNCTREAPMCTGDQMHDIPNNACAPANNAGCLAEDATLPVFDNGMCRETRAADCTGATPFFDEGACVDTCPEERRDTAADGITCQAATPPTDPPPPEDEQEPTPPSAATPAAASQKDEADYATGAGIVSGVVGVILALHYWGGSADAFAFSPDYGYSITESGYSYRYGGRLDFRKDEWHLYSAAGQGNANGEFGDLRYESGGEYSADFWTAAFSETLRGETADWRFSLSADYRGGIWKVSPTYRFHSRLEDDETETRNSLNLEGILRYNRWIISPSAGFNWRRPEEFGDNARFNLSAVRRF